MKKVVIFSGLAIALMASCKDKEVTPPATPPPVENPAPAPAPRPQTESSSTTTTTTTTTAAAPEDPDGTSVSIGNGGVSIKSKNGDSKNDVIVTKKEVTIERKN